MTDAWIGCLEDLSATAERLKGLVQDSAVGRAADLAIAPPSDGLAAWRPSPEQCVSVTPLKFASRQTRLRPTREGPAIRPSRYIHTRPSGLMSLTRQLVRDAWPDADAGETGGRAGGQP